MKDSLFKLLTDFNAFVIRISSGRFGSTLGTPTILLLETVGHEYVRLWNFAAKKRPPYWNYQKTTSRLIPIVVFDVIE